jgi:L-threonylcarbamoyladenylate synthase
MIGPRLLRIADAATQAPLLREIARHLEAGGLVAMPTETVYGFGCALQEEALAAIQRMKGRGAEKPFLVLVPGMAALARLAWTPEARELAEVFWPGALTLVLADPEGLFPPGVRSPAGTVAVRISPQPLARGVVDALGAPLVSTSANRPGEQPARSAEKALGAAWAAGAGAELWVLDGGPLSSSSPSTIVDCSGHRPRVLRAGAIPVDRLRCVLPRIHASS